jgi:hypothetical protein
MMLGTVTTRHILLHPLMIIHQIGMWGYLRLLTKCADHVPHCYTDFLHF